MKSFVQKCPWWTDQLSVLPWGFGGGDGELFRVDDGEGVAEPLDRRRGLAVEGDLEGGRLAVVDGDRLQGWAEDGGRHVLLKIKK